MAGMIISRTKTVWPNEKGSAVLHTSVLLEVLGTSEEASVTGGLSRPLAGVCTVSLISDNAW